MSERLIYITLCPRLTPYTDYVTPVNPETFAPTTPPPLLKTAIVIVTKYVMSYVATNLCALLY